MKWRIALILTAWTFIFSLTALAQGGGSLKMDGSEKKKVIDSIGYLLNNNYIFPDVAKKMNDHLEENYKKGMFDSITSVASFAKKLTSDLQSISKDKHLNNFKLVSEMSRNKKIKELQFDVTL